MGVGGFFGSVCRYLAGKIPLGAEGGFPYKTLGINVLGAFVLAAVAAAAAKSGRLSPRLVLMLKAGVCGGFTTFSTFAYETAGLAANGRAGLAALYAVLSVGLGVGAVYVAGALFG